MISNILIKLTREELQLILKNLRINQPNAQSMENKVNNLRLVMVKPI